MKELTNWKDDPFELIMFMKNLPKTTSAIQTIECGRLLFKVIPPSKLIMRFPQLERKENLEKNRINIYRVNNFSFEFWVTLIMFQIIYYFLSMVWPSLKYY